jgi:ABC-type transport system involved in Fe-S cluster assembly fused permease/ATPase subunit
MENMLDLLDEVKEVKDAPDALPMLPARGKIEFKNVTFSYNPERIILKDLSFTAMPGQTIAFVSTTVWTVVF